jgi:hypothetical protein
MYRSTEKTFSGTTPQALSDDRIAASWVLIQSRTGNATLRVVDSIATANGSITPTTGGTVLSAGGTLLLPFNGCPLTYDLQNIYCVQVTSGNGVDISYGT